MKHKIKFCLYILLALMPGFIKKFIYNTFLGCEIHKTAKIGFSYIAAKKIVMGPNSSFGHLNYVRNLELLEIGANTKILNSNYMKALPLSSKKHFVTETDRFPAFIIGQDCSVGSRHYFDCNNTIRIGNFSSIAGFGITMIAHGVNLQENRQETAPITVGSYCRVFTGAVLTRGSKLPDYSILAANSVLTKPYEQPYTLYAGVTAKPVKEMDPEWKFFTRKTGFVS